MKTVQASDAKTRLLQILDDVERGETFVITRRGRPVARLAPEVEQRRAEIEATIHKMREAAKGRGKITVEEILALRDEGRRV